MLQRADSTWQYTAEDRLLLHESGHALIDLLLTGEPSRVSIAPGFTDGVCRKVWDPDLARASGLDDVAYYCWGLHSAVAGIAAEELVFGGADDGGSDFDRAAGGKAERYLEIAGVREMSWGRASMVVKAWLRAYEHAWRAGGRSTSVAVARNRWKPPF